jgi:geranylgeranyl diphosphate synthase type II
MAGGKRVRPALTLEFCRLFGGDPKNALPFAAAVEMIHTFSLIHDDLPCMDDDDFRRGRPTCHKAFGEATALLAGDALLTRAFGVAASNQAVAPALVCEAVATLSRAAGAFGMIGGQVMDLAGEKTVLTEEKLLKLHRNKTGALISASALLGCLAAGYAADSKEATLAVQYAAGIGLAFQIVDDVLDATSDAQTVGKSVGSDAERGKTTFLTYYTPEEALAFAARVTEEAKNAARELPSSEFLMEFADYLARRTY